MERDKCMERDGGGKGWYLWFNYPEEGLQRKGFAVPQGEYQVSITSTLEEFGGQFSKTCAT